MHHLLLLFKIMAKTFRRRRRQRFSEPRASASRHKKPVRLFARLKKPRLPLLRRDPFGNIIFFKRLLISVLGVITYGRFNIINQMKVTGAEHLQKLPRNNVIFISNHQTYFADVIAMFHIFCGVKWRFKNINLPIYLLMPRVHSYYVAAEETMKQGGLLPKVLAYAGAVTVRRSWRSNGENVQRGVDKSAPDKIRKALEDGWLVNFPQGTTRAGAPVRRGAASLIRALDPIVVPVEIDGFRRAFDKKGFFFKKRGVKLSIRFHEPVQFGENASTDEIYAFLESHVMRNIKYREAARTKTNS